MCGIIGTMPTSSASDTSRRLLSLLSLLQVRRDWPGAVLAERLRVSPRTVRRDVDRLRALGYAVHAAKGPDGGYRLDAGSAMPPLLMDDEQAVALAVALRTAGLAGAGVEEAAARALATVRQVMPHRLRGRLDALEAAVVDRTRQAGSEADPEVLLAIADAIGRREELRFDYEPVDGGGGRGGGGPGGGGGEGGGGDDGGTGPAPAPASASASAPDPAPAPVPRRVQPHHLLARAGRWYLVAWEPARREWRIYRADRMTPRIPTGPRFAPREVPGGGPAAFVGAMFKGSTGPDAWPCQGEVILDRSAAGVAPFAGDGLVEPVGPNRCRLRAGAWSWPGLAASIARFDADVEVVGPPELREAFADLAERAARAAAGAPNRGAQV